VNRRAFVGALAGGLLAAPLAARAQSAGKIPRIAFLTTTSPENSPTTDAFRQGLRELGYVEGRTINIDYRWGRGSTEHFARFAAEAVRANVDVIVAANTRAGQAAQQATRMIPIVIAVIEDPSASGITSLARPGGNVTGISAQGPDLMAKRLQLLKEALPAATRIGLLVDTNNMAYRSHVEAANGAARGLGMNLHVREVGKPSDLDGALTSMKSDAVAGILVVGGTMFYANRAVLAERARKHGLPTMGGDHLYVEAGCLIGYAPSLLETFRRAATYVDKILKGAKPADLPVEQPTKFELVINLKTAKALGLTVPQSLLVRADQVIE
jgi:putative ABC transport system substrate-binding protein